jgi:hypothetical protein
MRFVGIKEMKEFILRKNLWMMDFITSIIYAFCFSCFLISMTDNPEWDVKRLLIYGVLPFVFTFFLALCLRKKIVWLPSWAWLGIFGGLIRILFIKLITVHKAIEYELKYSSSFLDGFFDIISYDFMTIILHWIVWSVVGLLCIFTVRLVAYLFRSIYISYNKNKTGFPIK